MTLQTPGRRWGPLAAQPRSSASPGAALGQLDPSPACLQPPQCQPSSICLWSPGPGGGGGGPPEATDYGGVGSCGTGKLSVGAPAPPSRPSQAHVTAS